MQFQILTFYLAPRRKDAKKKFGVFFDADYRYRHWEQEGATGNLCNKHLVKWYQIWKNLVEPG